MPGPALAPDLIARVRTRINQPNANGFVSDQEILDLLIEGASELYDLLVHARGEHYYAVEWNENTIPGERRMELPEDFYRLIALSASETPGGLRETGGGVEAPTGATWLDIERLNYRELALHDSRRGTSLLDLRYAVSGTTHKSTASARAELFFAPIPRAVWCIKVLYLPVLDLSLYFDGSTSINVFDGINGWDTFLVAHACATLAAVQEESPAVWVAQKAEVQRRVERLAADRDQHAPIQVADARALRQRTLRRGLWS
jgi:hypothetical protein